jgi:prepilin peptidase CpaA
MTIGIDLMVLLPLLFVAMWLDLRYRRIPNWLTFSGILSAFLVHGLEKGTAGLLPTAIGFVAGVLILLIPFAKGGMGAGDVKLLAMIGAWMGVQFLFPACLWMGMVGLFLSLYAIWRERIWRLALYGMSLKGVTTGVKVPYGIAIGLGTLIEIGRNVWKSGGGAL